MMNHKKKVEIKNHDKLSIVRKWARNRGFSFRQTKFYKGKKRLWIFSNDQDACYTIEEAYDKIKDIKTEPPKKRVRCKNYNIIRGYAQARNMSVRKLDFDENGNQLWQLLSSETREELSEPMTIEEFNARRAKGDTFYKRYFQPSLLRLVN